MCTVWSVIHAVCLVGGNTYKEGLTSHKLGLAYESTNEFDTAIQVLAVGKLCCTCVSTCFVYSYSVIKAT